MSELYKANKQYEETIDYYKVLCNTYGWKFDQLDWQMISLDKEIKQNEKISRAIKLEDKKTVNTIHKLIDKHNDQLLKQIGYQLINKEDEIKTYHSKEYGEGISISIDAESITIFLDLTKEIKKNLIDILEEVTSITDSNHQKTGF